MEVSGILAIIFSEIYLGFGDILDFINLGSYLKRLVMIMVSASR